MAEIHIVGEISGGYNFSGHSFFCVFEVVHGVQWRHVEGRPRGSTHVMENHHDGVVWSFPIDVHYAAQSIQGWPKIAIQVWALDEYGRKDLAGYGTCYVPLPGAVGGTYASHTASSSAAATNSPYYDGDETVLEVATWKPSYWHPNGFVRLYQQVRQMVMGGNPVLRDDSLVHTNDGRYKLHTIAGGTVTLRLNVVVRRGAALGLKFSK